MLIILNLFSFKVGVIIPFSIVKFSLIKKNLSKEQILSEIEKINKNLTKIEKIKKFFVIKEKFSIENGMMTPTLKLKRYKIINIYKNNFEDLYKK